MATSNNVLIKGILSFPSLYSPELYQGQPTDSPQYAAMILFDDQETYDKLIAIGMEVAAEEFGSVKKIPKKFPDTERLCIQPVTLSKEDDGIDFDGWAIKAKGGTTKAGTPRKILTVDRGRNQVGADDGQGDNGIFYAGCKVAAQVTLWTSIKYPHIRANLLLVQFVADGTPLGGGGSAGPKAQDLLDELEVYEDDDEADI